MKIVESYLSYLNNDSLLNEQEEPTTLLGKIKQSTVGGFKGQLQYAGAIMAAVVGFKALQAVFSKARRRCGLVFSSEEQAPAKKICVDKEKIKLYKSQLNLLNSKKTQCNREKNPVECQSKFEQKINSARINLQIAQEDYDEHMSEIREQYLFNEISIPKVTLAGAAATAFEWFVLGAIVEKTLFYSWRSAQALFSSASRRCGAFTKGNEREICMSRIRLQALSKKLAVINQIVAKCPEQKDPKACADRMSNEIEKIRSRMEMERNNISILTKRNRIEKMKQSLERHR